MLEAFYVFIFNKIDRVLYAQATLELSLLKSQANGIMSSFMASYKWHIQWCGKHHQIEYISLLTVWLLRLLALINCFLKSYGWTDWHTPLSTLEVEAGELGVLDHPQLHSELEARLGYQRPCLKNQKSEQSKTKPSSNQILHRSLLAELSVSVMYCHWVHGLGLPWTCKSFFSCSSTSVDKMQQVLPLAF